MIVKEKINLVGVLMFVLVEIGEGKDLVFIVIFEVYLEVELKGLENIVVEKLVVEVIDVDVVEMLEILCK